MTGTGGADVIAGLGGGDTIDGGPAADDFADAGHGTDTCTGVETAVSCNPDRSSSGKLQSIPAAALLSR